MLVRCNESCLYRLVMMIDRTEWLGSSRTYVWNLIYVWLITVLHSYWVFMESLNPVYYRKGSSKGEKSFRAVWGLQYPVCCGDTISAVSTKVHTLWSRGFNRYAHAVASANPQVHMNYTISYRVWVIESFFLQSFHWQKCPNQPEFIPILYILHLHFSHFADAFIQSDLQLGNT